ncbi:transporter [Flavobacterium sp. LB3P21]|uniref:transporter n=1 Tax=unclassified Flavobacterium TaxID=196869 RepID=UPI003AAF8487
MSKIKILLIAAISMLPSIHYGQHTDQINSNRPGETMSAYAVGKSVIQIETGVYGIKQNHSLLNYDANGFGVDATLRWGLFMEKLELIVDIQYQNETYTSLLNKTAIADFKQTVLGAKYLIYDPFKNYEKKVNIYSWKANRAFNWHQLIPAISGFVGVNYSAENNPYALSNRNPTVSRYPAQFSPKAMLITQNHFGDGRWVLVSNITADYIGTDFPSYGYAITLTRGFNNKWSGFVENQGLKSDLYADAIVRGGTAYLLNKDMQIDASISTSLKDTPSVLYGGIGFSWRYDANYQEVRINIDNKDSDKKALKRAKKTKKG